ncbi:MAG: tape measure protein [Turicibacter sp.]|nr:tape measure protein [Turicibacter sp.]
MEIFKLFGSIYVNNDKANKSISKTGEEAKKSGGLLSELGGIAKKVGGFIAGAFVVTKVVDFTKKIATVGIEYNKLKEQSETTWTTLLGSQDKAIEQLKRIEEFAAKTPFSKMGVDSMAKYLHNAGYEGEAVFDTLTKIGDMGSAFGVQEDSLVELTRQFSQVQQAGYAYTEDLNILADRGIPIYQAIADEVGVTVAEVKKMASEGKLTADIYNAAIDSMAETTAGAMDAQSQTFGGMMSTLTDNLETLAGLLTEKVFDALKGLLEKVLPVVEAFSEAYAQTGSFKEALMQTLEQFGLEKWSELITSVEDTWKWIKDLTTEFFENKEAMTWVGIALGILTALVVAHNWATIAANASMAIQEGLLWAMITAETIATGVTTAFGAAVAFLTSPITLVILGIGALIAIIYLLITNWDQVKEAGAKAWEWIKDKWNEAGVWFNSTIIEPIKNFFKGLWDNIKTKAGEAWEGVKNKWNAASEWFKNTFVEPVKTAFKTLGDNIKSFLTNPLESIKSSFKSAFNWIISKMNTVIGGLNSFQIPDWVPVLGGKGLNIPKIPMLYKGTEYFQPSKTWGNMAIVGEQGPELISNLPTGSKVHTADETRDLLSGNGGGVFIFQSILDGQVLAETTAKYSDIINGSRLSMTERGLIL